MTGQQLKNSILQMAIQGKLVPQDPHDEPASVLLERIREEKKRLVKEGKIKKKDLEETPISTDEIPFDIPEGWVWTRLSNIAYFFNGDRSSNYPNKNEYVLKGIAWINTGHIEPNGYLSTSLMNYITEEKYNSLSSGKIEKGDLVYCLRGATYGKVAKVEPYEKGAIASSLMIIRLLDINFRDYIFTYLKTSFSKEQLLKFANGAAQPNLAAKDVSKYLVPLPPLAEQRRIVEKLESLMPLIERYGKSQEALDALNAALPDQLRQSILQEAIQGHLVPQDPNEEPASVLLERIRAEKARLVKEGKLKKKDLEEKPISPDEIPFDIPKGWVWCRLGDLVMINPRNQADDNLDAAFIPMAYIDPNLLNTFRYEVKKWGQIKSGFTHLQDNDVVFAKITPCITNRKAAIMHDLPNGIGGGTTELNVYRVYGETINRIYLLYYLASEYFLHKASYKGTAGQQRIETKYVANKPFPLPPLSEQRRIVTKLEELLQEIDKLKA